MANAPFLSNILKTEFLSSLDMCDGEAKAADDCLSDGYSVKINRQHKSEISVSI